MSEDKVQLIVVENEPGPTEETETREAGFEPHGVFGRGGRLFVKARPVDYERFEDELGKVQAQMGTVFAKIDAEKPTGSFSLQEVSVSVAVTAEGSIGVATVGAEASITLTYKRS